MPLKHTVEEVILKNGARGLLVDAPGTTAVRYGIDFRAGTSYTEDSSRSQTAHVMEHMTFGANSKFNSVEAFSREFGRFGAYHNAYTSYISMYYYVDAALLEWKRILDLQLLAISEPRFPEELLGAEKSNVKEEIIGYGNVHKRILWQEVSKKAGLQRWYDPHELTAIDAITVDDIKHHHKKTHTTNNMRFIIAGDIQEHRKDIIDALEAVPLPKGERLPLHPQKAQATGPVFIERKDLPSLTFNIVFYVNRVLTREERRAMVALNYILTNTFHSRIFGEARTRGICYSMGAGIETDPNEVTEWSFGGQVSKENAKELFELIATELSLVAAEGVTEEELQEAKDARLGGLQMGTATVQALANWYGPDYFDYGRIDHVDDMPALVESTTTEEMQTLAKEFLASSAWAFSGIGTIESEQFTTHYKEFAHRLNKE